MLEYGAMPPKAATLGASDQIVSELSEKISTGVSGRQGESRRETRQAE
jgi:hypothetical protein